MLLKVEITLSTTFKHMTLLVMALLILIVFFSRILSPQICTEQSFSEKSKSRIRNSWQMGDFCHISKSLVVLWDFVQWDIFENNQMWKHGVEVQNLESLITWRTRRCQNWLQRRSSRTKWGALWALLKWHRGLRWEIPFLKIWHYHDFEERKKQYNIQSTMINFAKFSWLSSICSTNPLFCFLWGHQWNLFWSFSPLVLPWHLNTIYSYNLTTDSLPSFCDILLLQTCNLAS